MKEIEKFYSDLDATVYENNLFMQGTDIPKLSDQGVFRLSKVI